MKPNPRFYLVLGTPEPDYPDLPKPAPHEVFLWDRQEKKIVFTLHAGYSQAIVWELTKDAPFSDLEAWFNNLDNETLESEDIPATKPEYLFGQIIRRHPLREAYEGTVTRMKKLQKRLFDVSRLGQTLALKLRAATAGDDESRTFADTQGDCVFARQALRKLKPTVKHLEKLGYK